MSVKLKPSSTQFIGDIPWHWEIRRVKDFFGIGRGRVISKEALTEFGTYPVYSSQTVNNGIFGYLSTYDFCGEYLTWTTDGALAGTVYKRSGKFNCTNVCGLLKMKYIGELSYFFYGLSYLTPLSKRPDTNGAKVMNGEMGLIPIPLPPLDEQKKIAAYLDELTALIDEKKRLLLEQIEHYKALKQSVIYEAVTKGLNRSAPMKPSGIAWIGDIPAHWQVKRVKGVLHERGEKNEKNGKAITTNILSVMKDVGVINYKDKGNVGNKASENIEAYKLVHAGDLVINKMNVLIGSLGISKEFGALSVVYLVLKTKYGLNGYWESLFKTQAFQRHLKSIAKGILEIREAVDMTEFWMQVLPSPPHPEQAEIYEYISSVSKSIDEMLQSLENQVSLLDELKKSKIYEAVTKGL